MMFGRSAPANFLAYFTMGYDASIALEWEKDRQANPTSFTSQSWNQFYYVKHGLNECCGGHEPISDHIKILVDGKNVPIPDGIRTFKIVNINSGADGIFFWGTAASSDDELQEWTPALLDDKKFEVCATTGYTKWSPCDSTTGTATESHRCDTSLWISSRRCRSRLTARHGSRTPSKSMSSYAGESQRT